jgi:hypothetical protein
MNTTPATNIVPSNDGNEGLGRQAIHDPGARKEPAIISGANAAPATKVWEESMFARPYANSLDTSIDTCSRFSTSVPRSMADHFRHNRS